MAIFDSYFSFSNPLAFVHALIWVAAGISGYYYHRAVRNVANKSGGTQGNQ